MGGFLDAPIKDKQTECGSNDQLSWGACEMQGWRSSMEDTHICEQVDMGKDNFGMLFGVFDGHGGDDVSKFAKANFRTEFINQKTQSNNDIKKALINTFLQLDKRLKNQYYAKSIGSTGCVVFITKDTIYCANLGDSRAVLCQTVKRAVPLSEDHKPDLLEEKRRIDNAGHYVAEERVDGQLALSRAIGDHNFKDQPILKAEEQAVSPMPDVTIR